jgi:hypothetical protein
MKLVCKILIFICGLIGSACAFVAYAQQPDQFRTVFGRFAINLPAKYSEYEFVNFEIAKYKFPVRLYRWNFEHDVFTVCVGEGSNDLDKPEYAKLFLDDLRRQYTEAKLKQNGKIIDESPWAFEGHQGWQIIERHNGVVVDLRFFVVGYRFYTISVAVNDNQGISAARQDILASFHLLTDEQVAAEKELFIQSFAPPPLPQQPSIKRAQSDAQEENLRGPVRRVYVEEGQLLGKPQPRTKVPRTREDFDREGYLISKVDYINFMPYKAYSYGYMNGNRAYLLSERPALEEQLITAGPKVLQAPVLYEVEYRYNKSGRLEEMAVSGEKGKVKQTYSYQNKPGRRETTFSERSLSVKDFSVQWKSVVELDADGNAVSEKRIEYMQAPAGSYVSRERPVDSYDVISNAIRGQVIVPPNGVSKGPSVADVVKNPNLTVRVTEPLSSNTLRRTTESDYSYSYEYDSHGNWTKRIQSLVKRVDKQSTAVPVTVTYRTITYY